MPWRDVNGYEGLYQASEEGHIKNSRGALLKTHTVGGGYLRVQLYRNNHKRNLLVATIVARAFLGPAPEGHEVNHKSGNKQNNNYRNLEYMTRSENVTHAHHVLRRGGAKGSSHGMAKLTDAEVLRIRALRAQGQGQRQIAAQFGIDQTMVSRITLRKAWAHLPSHHSTVDSSP